MFIFSTKISNVLSLNKNGFSTTSMLTLLRHHGNRDYIHTFVNTAHKISVFCIFSVEIVFLR